MSGYEMAGRAMAGALGLLGAGIGLGMFVVMFTRDDVEGPAGYITETFMCAVYVLGGVVILLHACAFFGAAA